MEILKDIIYIGADDKEIELFENQYVLKNGMSYNSYLIKDEKNLVFDTIDRRVTNRWLENLKKELDGQNLDYLVVSHLEPDHAYNIELLVKEYPEMKIIGNNITFNMLPNFFNIDIEKRKVIVKEGETLNLGKHTLQFFMAPMVHWPEVMVTYEKSEKILFSADAFGKFGVIDSNEIWEDEARRYYFGIVGKYGQQVQMLLKKVCNLDIKIICPLHGPILKEKLEYYINKYDIWSKYEPEENSILIAYASIYGNTAEAVDQMRKILNEKTNKTVKIVDLVKEDMAKSISEAFRYNEMILASSSYNAGVFPPMEQFLNHLKARNYQKRKVAIIENGSWAPSAGKTMKNILQEMKDIDIIGSTVTIKSTVKNDNVIEMEELADSILGGEVNE